MVFYISGPKLLFETTEISTHPNSTQQESNYIYLYTTKFGTSIKIRLNRKFESTEFETTRVNCTLKMTDLQGRILSSWLFSFQKKNMAVITSLTKHEKSVWQVEHGTNVSPFVEGLRQFQITVYSCLHLSLITGSDFFKLSLLLVFGMPPLIFRHMLLDHQSVCKEHG